jgi:hypothetical protein
MTAPYRYRTISGGRMGSSYARDRARQDAARMARTAGESVEFIDPSLGVFLVNPWTGRRARWLKISDRTVSQALEDFGISALGYSASEVAELLR